jgi:hypothetical protein
MSKYITFIDQVGRNILGIAAQNQQTGSLTVANPVMIAVQPANGQLQIQLVPLFFAEFVKYSENNKRNFEFTYAVSSIALGSNFEVDEKIATQYERIVSSAFNAQPVTPVTEEPKVIKLFDE